MHKTLILWDKGPKQDNESGWVTKDEKITQYRVAQYKNTKNHTMISPEKQIPINNQEIYKYQKKHTIQKTYAVNVKDKV